jgi:hypothetical protein
MKYPSIKMHALNLSFSPEADALLSDLERSGEFHIGPDFEFEDSYNESGVSNDYAWSRGSGSVLIQDWWTATRVALRVGPGIGQHDIVLKRDDDSLLVHTEDGLDRVIFEGYLGLFPDASTLTIVFNDGSAWSGRALLSRISG